MRLHNKFAKFLTIIIVSIGLVGCNEYKKVDMIVHNATIYSVDDGMNTFEAMAINDGRIVELGPENQILNKYSSDQKIDAQKNFIYPGFIDAHSHFLGYGLTRNQVDLIGTQSFSEVLDRIDQYIQNNPNQNWIIGRGWDQNDWEIKEYPTNEVLNTRFPNKHIIMKRVDGHAMLVSNSVIELADISNLTQVPGGEILKIDGLLSGLLIDEAMTLVERIIPEPSVEHKTTCLVRAENDCFQVGLTSVCDAGLKVSEIELINQLHENGRLKMRVYAMYSADPILSKNLGSFGIKTERLNAKSVKVYCDGALGSRGAFLLETYSDDSLKEGSLITGSDSLRKWAELCLKDSFQLCVHCIGDAANRITLDVMGQVLGETNDRRWRIEHAQVVNQTDQQKFASFNVIPSMQPSHATSDMYWAEERLGAERIKNAYTLKSLLNQNGMIALGTDFPVESIDPLNTFYSAVVRKDKSNYPDGGFNPENSLSRLEALKGMTIWAAIASFEENEKGSLEVSKFADFVILDKDILTCSDEEILKVNVIKTCLNGDIVYEK